jgi:hypothetical protein
MENEMISLGFDGNDEIVYSESFNVYEDRLTINFLDRIFKFVFENTEPEKNKPDINFDWNDKEATVSVNKKFRNNLGAGTTEKMSILTTSDSKEILFSIFGQQVGNSKLIHITINFYKR